MQGCSVNFRGLAKKQTFAPLVNLTKLTRLDLTNEKLPKIEHRYLSNTVADKVFDWETPRGHLPKVRDAPPMLS